MSDGPIVWFTGLPASGKSTLARRVQHRLARRAVVLDSDEIRDMLGAHDYGPEKRDELYRVLGELAALLASQGHAVLVAATAPKRAHRSLRSPHLRVLEVFVSTPLADCAARDFKGLYERAASGELVDLPGMGAGYEPPLHPFVVANGGHDEAAVDAIVRAVDAARPQILREFSPS